METKFRAWIKDENKMIYPPNNRRFISFDGECYYIIQNVVNNKKQILQHEKPENIVLMQYSGYNDTKNKEIFVKDFYTVKGNSAGLNKYIDIIQKLDDIRDVNSQYGLANAIEAGLEITVIGNSFENPELEVKCKT
jgi:hypothetical protein